MKIAVLIKQVPGSDSAFRPSENELWIEEMQIQYEMNESDAYALEEALLIKENKGSGEVVVVCMGPSAPFANASRITLGDLADGPIQTTTTSPDP